MNNLFTRTNLNNFVYKNTNNIRDILKTSLNICNNKDTHTNKDKKNTYIPKIISSNYFKKKQAHKLPKLPKLPKHSIKPKLLKQAKLPKNIFTSKETIPKRIRELVWTTNNGEIFTNKCYVSWCTNNINVFNFQVGHDIPESKGGTIDIDNLKPICSNCNLSMSNKYTITEWSKLVIMNNAEGDKSDEGENNTFIKKIINRLPSLPKISLINFVLNTYKYIKI